MSQPVQLLENRCRYSRERTLQSSYVWIQIDSGVLRVTLRLILGVVNLRVIPIKFKSLNAPAYW